MHELEYGSNISENTKPKVTFLRISVRFTSIYYQITTITYNISSSKLSHTNIPIKDLLDVSGIFYKYQTAIFFLTGRYFNMTNKFFGMDIS